MLRVCDDYFKWLLAAVLDYQWLAGSLLRERNDIRLECAYGRTGYPRKFYLNGVEAFYFNPRHGMLTLSREGARMVFGVMPKNYKRVKVAGEEFAKHVKGSVLAPIVKGLSRDVRYGDEVFVVDEADRPLAVGKALLGFYEFKTGVKKGEVVRIRRKIWDG